MAQRESRLSRAIMQALRDEYGRRLFCFKVHGGPMMMAGLPDIVGMLDGRAFALETKIPDHGNEPTERQRYVHARMRSAGCIVGVPRSVADALDIVRRCTPPDTSR